jgi:methionyl-tRNA formyltransferase
MLMDAGMDTGPILRQTTLEIQPEWRASELEIELSKQGAQLLQETLPLYLRGEISPVPQPEEGVTYAPMINKSDGVLNLNQPLAENLAKIRAYYPWPGTAVPFQGQFVKITRATGYPDVTVTPGCRSVVHQLPAVGCAGGWILCEELQPSGKNVMSGEVFLRGYQQRWLEGSTL